VNADDHLIDVDSAMQTGVFDAQRCRQKANDRLGV